jgi:hypothetical protein
MCNPNLKLDNAIWLQSNSWTRYECCRVGRILLTIDGMGGICWASGYQKFLQGISQSSVIQILGQWWQHWWQLAFKCWDTIMIISYQFIPFPIYCYNFLLVLSLWKQCLKSLWEFPSFLQLTILQVFQIMNFCPWFAFLLLSNFLDQAPLAYFHTDSERWNACFLHTSGIVKPRWVSHFFNKLLINSRTPMQMVMHYWHKRTLSKPWSSFLEALHPKTISLKAASFHRGHQLQDLKFLNIVNKWQHQRQDNGW